MRLRLIIFSFAAALWGLSGPAWAAQANYSPISAAGFENLLPGNTIKGEYRFLRARTQTFNFSEHHGADGSTLYIEGTLRQTGTWYTIKAPESFDIGDRICYKYDNKIMGSGPHCFWVYQQDGCYYGYGRNLMGLKGPRNFNDWTARWVIEGSGNTCAAPVS